jgi:putative FmdB family regulatory protein
MIYVYECPKCECVQELVFRVNDFPQTVKCPVCGARARKILTAPAIQCDSAADVPWLESACKTLLPDDHLPLETRGEYKRYLKENHVVERA